MPFSKQDKIDIFENAISWIVVFAMFVYGGAKVVQFGGATTIEKSVGELTGMELMWAFYGYSKTYAILLGLFEIIGGTLILIKPTRLIGCLFTSTILVNVILQDVFYGVHVGALKAAILYQFLILVILWINRDQVFKSIRQLFLVKRKKDHKSDLFLKLGLAFVLFIFFRIGEYYLTIFF